MMLDAGTRIRLARARDALVETATPLPEIAREAGISRCHFIRVFSAVFGATPHALRTAARIERAKHLLAFRRFSTTRTCIELGFTSAPSFSALFARHVGETPAAYARRTRMLVSVPSRIASSLTPGCFTLMGLLPPDAFRTFR
jgi:transcriptional regulator GlxA family with amidase domain